MNCKFCCSQNTQKLHVVYNSGISHNSYGNQNQTNLSFVARPPTKAKWVFIVIIMLFFYPLISSIRVSPSSICLLWLPLGFLGYHVIKRMHFNFILYPKYLNHWYKCWLCHKCGEIFY